MSLGTGAWPHNCGFPHNFVPPNLPIKVAKKARKYLIISGLLVLLLSEKLIVCLVKFCLSIFAMQDRFPVGIVS